MVVLGVGFNKALSELNVLAPHPLKDRLGSIKALAERLLDPEEPRQQSEDLKDALRAVAVLRRDLNSMEGVEANVRDVFAESCRGLLRGLNQMHRRGRVRLKEDLDMGDVFYMCASGDWGERVALPAADCSEDALRGRAWTELHLAEADSERYAKAIEYHMALTRLHENGADDSARDKVARLSIELEVLEDRRRELESALAGRNPPGASSRESGGDASRSQRLIDIEQKLDDLIRRMRKSGSDTDAQG